MFICLRSFKTKGPSFCRFWVRHFVAVSKNSCTTVGLN